jgi:hypothetical protein
MIDKGVIQGLYTVFLCNPDVYSVVGGKLVFMSPTFNVQRVSVYSPFIEPYLEE